MQEAGRVLIVEDEPLIAEMLRDWVTELGCEIAGPAGTHEAALALLEYESVTGAILDVTVPDGVTYGVARVLRERGVPFVFATGHGAESIDPQFQDAPTLQKPFEFEAFTKVVAEFRKASG